MNWKNLPNGVYFAADKELIHENGTGDWSLLDEGLSAKEALNLPRSDVYFSPDAASGSDDSGSLVEVSNFNILRDNFGSLPGVLTLYGGFGSFAIAFRLDTIERSGELEDMLNELATYQHILSEDDLSERELAAQDEAWEDEVKEEYRRALISLAEKEDGGKEKAKILENMPDADLHVLFMDSCDTAGEYFVNEQADSMYINVSKVARATDLSDIKNEQERGCDAV
jgi:hypothetical protein